MQICKEIFFSKGGEGTHLPESQIFLDILGKNLVIFYKLSRFISEKILFFTKICFSYSVWKKNSSVSHFLGGGGRPSLMETINLQI